MKTFKIIPSLDVLELERVESLVKKLDNHKLIYGFKIGFSLGLTFGLQKVVSVIRRYSDLPIIYDHQKAATDIPDTGKLFAQTMSDSGIDEVILFPQAGPATLRAWVEAVKQHDIKVIVGALMTHNAYVESEGGYLCDRAMENIYGDAVKNGVSSFVIPLTKPEKTNGIIKAVSAQLYSAENKSARPESGDAVNTEKVSFPDDAEFYSPGYGRQGGDPAAFPFIKRHYLIAGRAILNAEDPKIWLEETAECLETIS